MAEYTFSHPDAGKLLVVVSATFLRDGAPMAPYDRAVDPYPGLTLFVEPGVGYVTLQLSARNPSATWEMDYPGGSAEIGLRTSFSFVTSPGEYTLTVKNILISCNLAIGS